MGNDTLINWASLVPPPVIQTTLADKLGYMLILVVVFCIIYFVVGARDG